MSAEFPTDSEARGITDYAQAHSFDDAQCAECGTVRWEHAAHFLDFLAPLIRAREAAAWDAGAEAAWDAGFDAGYQYARAVNPEWPDMPTNPFEGADDARN